MGGVLRVMDGSALERTFLPFFFLTELLTL